MATARHVWGRYSPIAQQGWRTRYREVSSGNGTTRMNVGEGRRFTVSSSYYFSTSSGNYSNSGTMNTFTWTSSGSSFYGGGYILGGDGAMYYSPSWSRASFGLITGTSSKKYTSESYQEQYTYYTQGAFLKYVSDANRSAVGDGYDGSYYNVYQGQDNIDPQSVNLPASIRGGNTVAVTVSPSTGKKYEGNVSYQYQYRLDGGSWQTLGTSGATSYNLKVPNGTTTVEARARAQDDLGFTSGTWVKSQSVTVINNQPPTAPGSIEVKNAVAGQYATVTITEASDPDGYVTKYIFERQIDGGNWQQVSTTTTLAFFEKVGEEWATVAYRACAVDNEETQGPYVTSETFTVNVDFVIISGPPADLGDRPGKFGVKFVLSISDAEEIENTSITTTIDLNGERIVSQVVESGQSILLLIDTRYLRGGRHRLQVHAEKEDHMAANADYVFNVPDVKQSLLERGEIVVMQDSQGRVQCPVTFGRSVYGKDGKNFETLLAEGLQLAAGSYTGTGTSGQGTPNLLAFPFAPRAVILYRQDGGQAVHLAAAAAGSGGTSGGITFTFAAGSVSWYASTAAAQMNEADTQYGYYAFGNWKGE